MFIRAGVLRCMKVKLIKSAYATHNICEKVGSVIDKPDAVAEELIEMELAVKVSKSTKTEVEKHEEAEAAKAAESTEA